MHTRRTLFKALTGAHKTKDGTLYTCPLCAGARKLLVQTDRSDDPNYPYTFKQLCGCDHQQLATKLMQLGDTRLIVNRLDAHALSG